MAPEVSPGSRNRESSWLPNRKMITVMTREKTTTMNRQAFRPSFTRSYLPAPMFWAV